LGSRTLVEREPAKDAPEDIVFSGTDAQMLIEECGPVWLERMDIPNIRIPDSIFAALLDDHCWDLYTRLFHGDLAKDYDIVYFDIGLYAQMDAVLYVLGT
jgi:hypothetical protein